MVMPTGYLSEDLLRDILSRLPVKPLVRFRLVCKSWSALLKSRDFTTAHLSRSANNGCEHLLLNIGGAENHTISLISSEALDDVAAVKVETPEKGLIMVGSCNGLVCLSNSCLLILVSNPATREHKILPTPRIHPTSPNNLWKVSIGFGYHLNEYNYKVVRIVYSKDEDDRPLPVEVEVYSTSTRSWRSIDDAIVPCFIEQRMCSVILKGLPYWLGFGPFSEITRFGQAPPLRDEFVVSFDMGKEVFRQVHVPYDGGSYNKYSKKLGVLNELLAMIYYPCHDPVSYCIEFWVMKDDGVIDEYCWSKLLNIIGPFSSIGLPLGCWKDGVVVWHKKDTGELFLYDPNFKAVNKLSTYGAPKSTRVSSYMESFVPVDGENKDMGLIV